MIFCIKYHKFSTSLKKISQKSQLFSILIFYFVVLLNMRVVV